MKITTRIISPAPPRIISPAILRIVDLKCPSCGGSLGGIVDIEQKEGQIICYLCGAKFEWKEEE